jgi:hypothetical protein
MVKIDTTDLLSHLKVYLLLVARSFAGSRRQAQLEGCG